MSRIFCIACHKPVRKAKMWFQNPNGNVDIIHGFCMPWWRTRVKVNHGFEIDFADLGNIALHVRDTLPNREPYGGIKRHARETVDWIENESLAVTVHKIPAPPTKNEKEQANKEGE